MTGMVSPHGDTFRSHDRSVPARLNHVILPDDVIRVLSAGAGIEQVTLAGSRAGGLAGPQSDWDFTIATTAFADVRDAMPHLVARFGQLWPSGIG
jgi:hypothetical protein